MSKWDTIVKRDSLQAFPCIADLHLIEAGDDQCEDPNFAPCPDPGRCALRPIYEEYMAMRAVVEVERGLKTPQAVADQWRRIADKTRPADEVLAAAFDEKADAWEGIA